MKAILTLHPRQELLILMQDRSLDTEELLDLIPDATIEEILEHFRTHCNCGEPFAEGEDEIGFCKDCR